MGFDFLAVLLGPIVYFDRQLVILGAFTAGAEIVFIYWGKVGIATPSKEALTGFLIFRIVLGWLEEKLEAMESGFVEPVDISRATSLFIGLVIYFGALSPQILRVLRAHGLVKV